MRHLYCSKPGGWPATRCETPIPATQADALKVWTRGGEGKSLPSSPGLTMNLPSRISRQPITKSLPKKSRTLCRQPSKKWGGDRATVEVEIAKTIHELFDVFGENPRPVIQESTEGDSGKANLICHFEKRRKNKCRKFSLLAALLLIVSVLAGWHRSLAQTTIRLPSGLDLYRHIPGTCGQEEEQEHAAGGNGN